VDSELVVRAQSGDEVAFARLAAAAADRLHAVAYRILRDPSSAEDATQQALLAMWQRLPSLRDPERFEAWAYRTLVRICYAESARARRWRSILAPWPDRELRAPERMASVEEQERFDHVFRGLSVEHRAVIVLHHYLGMTQDEIGATLGVAPGTVKSRLHRAIAQLRTRLDSDAGPLKDQAREVAP
jgi:RNA polymerase sigma-70 factor (ECF subfamily)